MHPIRSRCPFVSSFLVVLLVLSVLTMGLGGGAAESADEAFFEVEITGMNDSVSEGERFVVTATVTNTGTVEDSQQIHLKNDADEIVASVAQPPVTLAPGERKRVTLTWRMERGDAGSQEFSVQSNDDVTRRSIDVQPGPSLELSIGDVESPITAGETLTVPITVTNAGNGTETARARLAVNGSTADEREIDLDPGESTAVTLTWESNASHAGERTLVATVADERETTTIVVETPNRSTDSGSSSGSSSGGTPPANVAERNSALLTRDGSAQVTGSDVERITVENDDDVTGLVLVNRLHTVPDGVAGVDDLLRIYRIDVPDELTNHDATIEFALPAWALDDVDPDAVDVVYWTGEEWTELDAETAATEDGGMTIEAETPGFSVFAITTGGTADQTEEQAATETPTDAPTATDTPMPTATSPSTSGSDASSTTDANASTATDESTAAMDPSEQSIPGFGVVAALVALLVAALVGRRGNRRT
ncbi:CARDB domain-containing protein [Halopenitus persicus]|uniref:CARDB domain-containing protein n=1 Tax=Halopenitus persicus TaxID=1048396 RepID=UPI000BBA828F|nr:CARDB domain-containing protein [Halopenitus persicus]